MVYVPDFVWETSSSTGTGNLSMTPMAKSFTDAYGTGGTDKFPYYAVNPDVPGEWERGTGHVDTGALVRDTVIEGSNGTSPVNFSAGTKHITSDIPASQRRELLTAPRTYYVNGSTGSDSNDGLTSGTAFATIQKAVDVVAGLDLGIFDVTTSIAAGTYAEAVVLKPLVGAGRHYIVGDEVTPANVKVHAPPGSDAVYAPSTFSTYHLRGMELQALGSGTFADSAIHLNGNGSVYIRNLRFLECEMAHMRVGAGAYLDTEGDYTIAGDAAYHVAAISGTVQIRLNTVTLVGTPSFSKVGVSAFVWADRLAFVQVTNVTFVGSATGKRYNVNTNSVVYTSVGLQLPGNTAGTATLGGQYV